MNEFNVTVRRKLNSGVETFSGRVRMNGRTVFKIAESESKQSIQGDLAAWIRRHGKAACATWDYAGVD